MRNRDLSVTNQITVFVTGMFCLMQVLTIACYLHSHHKTITLLKIWMSTPMIMLIKMRYMYTITTFILQLRPMVMMYVYVHVFTALLHALSGCYCPQCVW